MKYRPPKVSLERLSRWQWVDLFREDGYGRLVRAQRLKTGELAVKKVRE